MAPAAPWTPRPEGDGRPIYLALATAIEANIGSGRLRPGQRLPP
jgi:DNA-binding GntR family transcriptional regulator